MIIGLHGPAGSGKDTVARYLEKHHDFRRFAFAEPIKEAVSVMLDIDTEALEDAGMKEEPLPEVGKSLRELYQSLGTEWGRKMIHQDIWLFPMRRWLDMFRDDDVVVSDVRFENEAALIRERGGIIVHLARSDAPRVRSHSSESGVDFKPGDLTLDNNSAQLELIAHANQLVCGLRLQCCTDAQCAG